MTAYTIELVDKFNLRKRTQTYEDKVFSCTARGNDYIIKRPITLNEVSAQYCTIFEDNASALEFIDEHRRKGKALPKAFVVVNPKVVYINERLL